MRYPSPSLRAAVPREMHPGHAGADVTATQVAARGAIIHDADLGGAVPAVERDAPGPASGRGVGVHPGEGRVVVGAETGDGEVCPATTIKDWTPERERERSC